jgi:ribonuclease HIII
MSSTKNLDAALRRWRLTPVDTGPDMAERAALGLLLQNGDPSGLWDEPVLIAARDLIDAVQPNAATYADRIDIVRDHANTAKIINDHFYTALTPYVSNESLLEELCCWLELSNVASEGLLAQNAIDGLRNHAERPSLRIRRLLESIQSDCDQALPTEVFECARSLEEREAVGLAQSIVIATRTDRGVVVPLNAATPSGTGTVSVATPCSGVFRSAVERGCLALRAMQLLAPTADVVFSADHADTEYTGSSIALCAAVATYSSATGRCIDPYTAFTGDLQMHDGDWQVSSVEGIPEKVRSAIHSGYRRILIPFDNRAEILSELPDGVHVIPVADLKTAIHEVFQKAPESVKAESVGERKAAIIESAARRNGWQIESKDIQNGVQYSVSPMNCPTMKVSIYSRSGKHVANRDLPEFAEVLGALSSIDSPPIAKRSVNDTFMLASPGLRGAVRAGLEALMPSASAEPPHSEYSFTFENSGEKIVTTQYMSGKLVLQGRGGPLYASLLNAVIPAYNRENPAAGLDPSDFVEESGDDRLKQTRPSQKQEQAEISLPYIGTDESGKGDYFGPLVIAAMWIDADVESRLELLGARDSKKLSDTKCLTLAREIAEQCPGCFTEVVISPSRYNSLYADMKVEKKNLNHLLAWGHARAIEDLAETKESHLAIADQFGDEAYIQSRLMERGKKLRLIQQPRAEVHIGVAAASIIARARFLVEMRRMSDKLGQKLPKGASPEVEEVARRIVARGGPDALKLTAKWHFKTTQKVLEP